ncbi:hypothetical protein IW492_07620 [Enterococcus sp. BWB1-3]|uniref:hypothetical protein n=1 Tax=unclassified Enterococcus TaxID=2608891 RepID=UPI0019223CE1|nr:MULTISPECIES: hypothetical protein [unclassified Enterococcus]MBL1229101.1 hypothetical protein [Enterococcus sp. BWB1-3]MCB5953484.1 hypothetical protein [Enterococcus sp. CWB-B31]
MLAPIIDRMLSFNLGEPGRFFVELIQNNLLLFLIIFAVYGGIVLYAKYIWVEYLPGKMKAFLEKSAYEKMTADQYFENWLVQRQQLPKYILVPTQNEWWVKPAAKMSGQEKMLFYNSKKKKLSERERFSLLVEEMGMV